MAMSPVTSYRRALSVSELYTNNIPTWKRELLLRKRVGLGLSSKPLGVAAQRASSPLSRQSFSVFEPDVHLGIETSEEFHTPCSNRNENLTGARGSSLGLQQNQRTSKVAKLEASALAADSTSNDSKNLSTRPTKPDVCSRPTWLQIKLRPYSQDDSLNVDLPSNSSRETSDNSKYVKSNIMVEDKKRAASEGDDTVMLRQNSGLPSPGQSSNHSDVFEPVVKPADFQYGPGIVGKLRSRFINLHLKQQEYEKMNGLRRVVSDEQLLDSSVLSPADTWPNRPVTPPESSAPEQKPPIAPKRPDLLKKARSMEILSNSEKTLSVKSERYELAPAVMILGEVISPREHFLINENLIIIEQPLASVESKRGDESSNKARRDRMRKMSGSSLEEEELPKPDIVRACKKMFESDSNKVQGGSLSRWNTGFSNKFVTYKSFTGRGVNSGTVYKSSNFDESDGANDVNDHVTNTTDVVSLTNSIDSKNSKSEKFEQSFHIEAHISVTLSSKSIMNEKINNGLINNDVTDNVVVKGNEVKLISEDVSSRIGSQGVATIFIGNTNNSETEKNKTPVNGSVLLNNNINFNRPVSPVSPTILKTTERPKIVSIISQKKLENKEKPIVSIKPITKEEQKENQINESKSNSIIIKPPTSLQIPRTDENEKPKILLKSRNKSPAVDNSTMVFNFTKIDTKKPEHVTNINRGRSRPDPQDFFPRDDSGVKILRDFERTDTDDFYTTPFNFTFVGDNIILGKSSLLKARNKKLKILFDDDATSTYEYPSETSLLDESGLPRDIHKPIEDQQVKKPSSLKPAPIGSLGGLSSYTPSSISKGTKFQLGVTRNEAAPLISSREKPPSPRDDSTVIKPASPGDTTPWSNNASESDLLF